MLKVAVVNQKVKQIIFILLPLKKKKFCSAVAELCIEDKEKAEY